MFSNRLILSAFAAIVLSLSVNCLHAATAAPTAVQYVQGYPGYNNNDSSRYSKIRSLEWARADYKKDLDSINEKLAAKADDAELLEEKKYIESELKEIDGLRKLLRGQRGAGAGDLIAKGLAGDKNMKALDDVVVDGIGDGIKKGLQIQLASATGEFAREQIKGVYDNFGAGIVGWFVRKASESFNELSSILFHDGKKPFDSTKLIGWQTVILDAFNNINGMLEQGYGSSMRGMDQTSRQFDDDASSQPSQQSSQTQPIDAWKAFSEIYVEQFKYFSDHIRDIYEYYETDDEEEQDVVIFYAEKICQMLDVMQQLLAESKSFQDFNKKISSNKSIVKAMSSYIQRYFTLLSDEVSSRSYSFNKKSGQQALSSSTSSMNSYRGYGSGYDSGFNNGSFSGSQY